MNEPILFPVALYSRFARILMPAEDVLKMFKNHVYFCWKYKDNLPKILEKDSPLNREIDMFISIIHSFNNNFQKRIEEIRFLQNSINKRSFSFKLSLYYSFVILFLFCTSLISLEHVSNIWSVFSDTSHSLSPLTFRFLTSSAVLFLLCAYTLRKDLKRIKKTLEDNIDSSTKELYDSYQFYKDIKEDMTGGVSRYVDTIL